jgi:hypothetical protein
MIHDLDPLPVDTPLPAPVESPAEPCALTEAEFEDASRLEFMMAHPEDGNPGKVYLVDDVRGWTHHVLPLLTKLIPKLGSLPTAKLVSRLRGNALETALIHLGRHRNRWHYDEHIELALDCAHCAGLFETPAPEKLRTRFLEPYARKFGILPSEPLGAWFHLYRFWVGSRRFKEKLRLRSWTLERARTQVRNYVERLFAKRARLLVIRLDLSYKEKWASEITIEQAKRDLQRFLANLRSKRQTDVQQGYIWRLEDGEKTGYHFHVAFFLNNRLANQAVYHAMALGEYWEQTITKGRGRYWNCNAIPNPMKRAGIGVVNWHDDDKRSELQKALDYLTKAAQMVLIRGGRSMGHGQVDEAPMVGPGRPRRPKADTLPDETGPAETSPLTYLPDVRDFEDTEQEVSDVHQQAG